ncbi:MAG: hypothetical protein ABF811_08040 [Pseudoclavibacter sp.]|jgi:hypothetical protein
MDSTPSRICVFVPGAAMGDEEYTNPDTGRPWTLPEAQAAVRWARLHGIDAEIYTEPIPQNH